MIRGFEHVVREAPALMEFRGLLDTPGDAVETMLRRYVTASGGQQVMISAALSMIPTGWLSDLQFDDAQTVPPFRLGDVGRLDRRNLRALVQALAAVSAYPEEVG